MYTITHDTQTLKVSLRMIIYGKSLRARVCNLLIPFRYACGEIFGNKDVQPIALYTRVCSIYIRTFITTRTENEREREKKVF